MLQVLSPKLTEFKNVGMLPGHVAVFPGYTLERATERVVSFQAARHQVVSLYICNQHAHCTWCSSLLETEHCALLS